MEPVLLGLASPSTAVGLLEKTVKATTKPFAYILNSLAEGLKPNEATGESPEASLADRSSQLQDELAQRIHEALVAAGVDLSNPLRLNLSEADGSLEIAGDHPQATLIEAALAQDPDLADDFRKLLELQQQANGDSVDAWDGEYGNSQGIDAQGEALFELQGDTPQLELA